MKGHIAIVSVLTAVAALRGVALFAASRGGALYPIEEPVTNYSWNVGGDWAPEEMAVGYALAATGTTSYADFEPTANAMHVRRWTRRGYSRSFMPVESHLPRLAAGINGTLFTSWDGAKIIPHPNVETNDLVVAALFATNGLGLVHGIGEFWYETNSVRSRYVWKDMAFNRYTNNLVRFATSLYPNGDILIEYGDTCTNYFGSAIQYGTNISWLADYPPGRSFLYKSIAGLSSGMDDTDGDDLSDFAEISAYWTDPRNPDTDGDGLPDGYEIEHSHTDPLLFDTDGDGLVDGIDPHPTASDGDCYGQSDAWVAATFTNAPTVGPDGWPGYVASVINGPESNFWYSLTVTVSEFDASGRAFIRVGDERVVMARDENSQQASATFLLMRGRGYDIRVTPSQNAAMSATPTSGDEPAVAFADGAGEAVWHPSLEMSMERWNLAVSPTLYTGVFGILRDLHPDLYRDCEWSSSNPHFSLAPSDELASTVTWDGHGVPEATLQLVANLYDRALTNSIGVYCEYIANDGPEPLPYGRPCLAVTNTVHLNNDCDSGVTNEFGRFVFDYLVGEMPSDDDDIVPLAFWVDGPVETNGTLSIQFNFGESSTLKVWEDRRHGRQLEYSLEYTGEALSRTNVVYVEGCGECSVTADECSVMAEWSVGGVVRGRSIKTFTVVEPVCEPICAEEKLADGVLNIYNPCCIVKGCRSWFKVAVDPEDYPDDRIVWTCDHAGVEFDGVNTGRVVCVRAVGGSGCATLTVKCGDSPSAPMKFTADVVEPTIVKVFPIKVIDDEEDNPISEDDIASMFDKAREIWRQAGFVFEIQPLSEIRDEHYADVVYGNTPSFYRVLNLTNGLDGVKVFFFRGVRGAAALANANGVVLGPEAVPYLVPLAHEIGHVFGLKDIYTLKENGDAARSLVYVMGPIAPGRVSARDWNNGTGSRYYEENMKHEDVVKRVVMFGICSEANLDLPHGAMEGVVRTNALLQLFNVQMAPVGKENIVMPPVRQQ